MIFSEDTAALRNSVVRLINDYKIIIEGKELRTNKTLLVLCSEYFRTYLSTGVEKGGKTDKQKEARLDSLVDYEDMKMFLDVIHGTYTILTYDVRRMMQVSDVLMSDELKYICNHTLSGSLTEKNVESRASVAQELNMHDAIVDIILYRNHRLPWTRDGLLADIECSKTLPVQHLRRLLRDYRFCCESHKSALVQAWYSQNYPPPLTTTASTSATATPSSSSARGYQHAHQSQQSQQSFGGKKPQDRPKARDLIDLSAMTYSDVQSVKDMSLSNYFSSNDWRALLGIKDKHEFIQTMVNNRSSNGIFADRWLVQIAFQGTVYGVSTVKNVIELEDSDDDFTVTYKYGPRVVPGEQEAGVIEVWTNCPISLQVIELPNVMNDVSKYNCSPVVSSEGELATSITIPNFVMKYDRSGMNKKILFVRVLERKKLTDQNASIKKRERAEFENGYEASYVDMYEDV